MYSILVKGLSSVIASRTGGLLGLVLLALSWIGAASAAELEMGRFLVPAATIIQAAGPYIVAKRARVSHHPTRLALQEDVRMPCCSIPLFLGVGY
jgi:hypothetical protein